MVNRNQGSGTRALIDRLLQGVRPAGYAVQPRNHHAVAAAIVQHRADWGVTLDTIARNAGLGFLPLREERYDFVVPRSRAHRPAVLAVQETADRAVHARGVGAHGHEGADVTAGGIVLCGGRSRRMGSPKALLPFGGETMLQRVVRLLGTVVSPIAVVGAPLQSLPDLSADVIVTFDDREGRGPLRGSARGTHRASRQRRDRVRHELRCPALRSGLLAEDDRAPRR